MNTMSIPNTATKSGDLMQIHSESACEHCGEVVLTDALAFTLPPDDDPQERNLPPIRLHALCANDYLMRVLCEVEVDPDELVAVMQR